MSGEIGKTQYQLFVKGIRGENISFVVHKVSWELNQATCTFAFVYAMRLHHVAY